MGGVKVKQVSAGAAAGADGPSLLEQVQVVPVTGREERRRLQKLLREHHYLGGLKAVGEQMHYAAVDAQGNWLALLIFSAAARHLKHRDQWIGWTGAQRERRLSLVANHSLFLILPEAHVHNLGSRVLRPALDRLSEDIGFPLAAQVALLTRQRAGRRDETVGLITDLTPAELPAAQWLQANRLAGGIENGSHQRLDITLNDDRCRVRSPNGLLILGMLRRVVISLFIHWRHRQKRPQHKSLTDFQTALGEDNLAKAFAFVTNQHPKLT